MRSDMHKVMTDTYRNRGYDAKTSVSGDKRVGKNAPLEDLPQKESMSKRYKAEWCNKELADRINPLKRFLKSRVGRPWDEVFSEICKENDSRSSSQSRLIDNLQWIVRTNLFIIDGKLCNERGSEIIYSRYGGNLYVCPETGILRELKKEQKKWDFDPESVQAIQSTEDRSKRIEKIDGIWYYVDYKRNTNPPLKRPWSYRPSFPNQYGTSIFSCEYLQHFKKQLNKKEKKIVEDFLDEVKRKKKRECVSFWRKVVYAHGFELWA